MMKLFFKFSQLVCCSVFIWVSGKGGVVEGVCFRRFDDEAKACKGLISSGIKDIGLHTCCERYGQGFAKGIVRVENRKKWFECESCKVLRQTQRQEVLEGDSGAYETEDSYLHKDTHAEPEETKDKESLTLRRLHNKFRSEPSIRHRPNTDSPQEIPLNSEADGRSEADGDNEEEKEFGGTYSPKVVPLNMTSADAGGWGHWGQWSDWSGCSGSCGVGIQKRRRTCLTVACGEEYEERACENENTCPVTPSWMDWNPWTPCTVTCGNGTRSRIRLCLNSSQTGSNCHGSSAERELCFLPPCKVDGGWSSWSLWSVCSLTCGQGEQVRTRSCDRPAPSHGGSDCQGEGEERMGCDNLPCPVDGGWSTWSRWSNCSASCGEGIQSRSRSCTNPVPDHGGQPCDGAIRESMPCVTRTNCPVDGNWTEWSRWDICSGRPCSGQLGHRVRYRSCTNPRPMFGGRACRGRTWSREACYNNDFCTQPVDGGWCEWVDWSSCSVGLRTRSRLCECPPPVNGGEDCQGINVEEKSCQTSVESSSADPLAKVTNDVISRELRNCTDDSSGDGNDDDACADEEEKNEDDEEEEEEEEDVAVPAIDQKRT